jgi:hypothetical protein
MEPCPDAMISLAWARVIVCATIALRQASRSLLCCSGTATALTVIKLLLPLVYYLHLDPRQGKPPAGLRMAQRDLQASSVRQCNAHAPACFSPAVPLICLLLPVLELPLLLHCCRWLALVLPEGFCSIPKSDWAQGQTHSLVV